MPEPTPPLVPEHKKHARVWFALCLLVVGAVCSLHHALLWRTHGSEYTPLSTGCMLSWDETAYYAPPVAEKLKGHWFSSNPHFAEGKERVGLPAWEVGAWLVTLLALATGTATPAAFILADIVFPMLCCWGFYRLLREQKCHPLYAASAAAAIILANDFLTRSQLGLQYFNPPTPAAGGFRLDPLFFTRTFSPNTVLPVMLLFLFSLSRLTRRPDLRRAALCGACAGLLFYTYFYYWSAMLVIGGILFLLCLVQRDWPTVRALLLAFAACLLVASLFCYRLLQYRGSAEWEIATLKGGMGLAYPPEWWFLAVSSLLALAVWFTGRPRAPRRWLAASLLAGGLLLVLSATGFKVIQPDHWRLQVFKFLVVLTLALLAEQVIKHFAQHRAAQLLRYSAPLILLAAALLGAHRQWLFTQRRGEHYSLREKSGVLTYLNTPAVRPGTVLCNEEALNLLITSYTPHYVFVHPLAYPPVSPRERLERSWIAAAILPPGQTNYNLLYLARGKNTPQLQALLAAETPPADEAALLSLLAGYQLDYLVLRAGEQRPPLARDLFPHKVYADKHFVVYRRPLLAKTIRTRTQRSGTRTRTRGSSGSS